MLPFGKITSQTTKIAYQLHLKYGQGTSAAEAFLCPCITSPASSPTSLQSHSEARHDPSVPTQQCTEAWRRRKRRKHLSFFTEYFLFHLFLCSEQEKKESVLNVMYRDSASATAAVLLLSCEHPCSMAFYLPITDMTGTAVTMSLAATAASEGSGPSATGYGLNAYSQSPLRSVITRTPQRNVGNVSTFSSTAFTWKHFQFLQC